MIEKDILDLPVKGSFCPVCKKETVQRYKPFCSGRCADVDLGRWLNETYSIAGEPADLSDVLPEKDEQE